MSKRNPVARNMQQARYRSRVIADVKKKANKERCRRPSQADGKLNLNAIKTISRKEAKKKGCTHETFDSFRYYSYCYVGTGAACCYGKRQCTRGD